MRAEQFHPSPAVQGPGDAHFMDGVSELIEAASRYLQKRANTALKD